jgi:hypothetical protein
MLVFNPTQPQSVTLSATVLATGSTVNGGSVTFNVVNATGTVVVQPVPARVANGLATVMRVALPAGLPAGTYTINASYSDSTGRFAGSSGKGTMLVNPAPVTGFSLPTLPPQAFASSDPTLPPITVNLTVGNQPVTEGQLTFVVTNSSNTIVGSPVTVNVTNGTATVKITIPPETPHGTYTITPTYSDTKVHYHRHLQRLEGQLRYLEAIDERADHRALHHLSGPQ